MTRALALGAVVLAAAGCNRDLGDCNLDGLTPNGNPIEGPAAFDIAFRSTDGLPMYEGQALVQSTCGDGSFCHAPTAVGVDRIGVPAGLNFDLALACVDGSQDSACAQPIESCAGGQTESAYCDRLSRLQGNQDQVNNWAQGMIQQLRTGKMPPGEAGRSVFNPVPWIRQSDGSQLPAVESSEGREIVRNWLACQAPLVARTEVPPSTDLELEPCQSVDDEICIYNGPEGAIPDPVWSEIYWSVIFPTCVVCHGPSNTNVDQNPDNPLDGQIPGGASADALAALDMTGTDTTDTSSWPAESWSAVVDAPASTQGQCVGQGTVVVPFDSSGSILAQKLEGTQSCGTEMPPGTMISITLIQVIEEWIDLGAPND